MTNKRVNRFNRERAETDTSGSNVARVVSHLKEMFDAASGYLWAEVRMEPTLVSCPDCRSLRAWNAYRDSIYVSLASVLQ